MTRTTGTHFDHRQLWMGDEKTLHVFYGEAWDGDMAATEAFADQHGMARQLGMVGGSGDSDLAEYTFYTTDDDTAMLFKLTFGGAA